MGRQDMEWISEHQKELEVYRGKWIAVCSNELVGVGKTAKEALEQGKKKGLHKPHLTMVMRKDEGMYVLRSNLSMWPGEIGNFRLFLLPSLKRC